MRKIKNKTKILIGAAGVFVFVYAGLGGFITWAKNMPGQSISKASSTNNTQQQKVALSLKENLSFFNERTQKYGS